MDITFLEAIGEILLACIAMLATLGTAVVYKIAIDKFFKK